MILYRPVGMEELHLIFEADLRAFPPRLPEQPIFYPVLNFGYAEQIARDWNTRSRSSAGYVTRFEVEDEYVARFDRRVVGGREHEELWVPAEDLEEFNRHIVGRVGVVSAYFGPGFRGHVPEDGPLRGADAREQISVLAEMLREDETRLWVAVVENAAAVFMHYLFWERYGSEGERVAADERDGVAGAVRDAWSGAFPGMPLTITL